MGLDFLKNPLIKNVATKQLKNHFTETGTTMIAVALSAGELTFTEYSEPVTVMTDSSLEEIKKVLAEYSVTIENLKSQLNGKHD